MEWVNIVIQGVLIGGLYAMFAAGLALIFGVMRLVNIAHGDLIVLAAYIALMTTDTLGLNPLLAILIVAPIMAAIGYCLQRALLTFHSTSALDPRVVALGHEPTEVETQSVAMAADVLAVELYMPSAAAGH